jgi:PTS system mannose-specific IIA component
MIGVVLAAHGKVASAMLEAAQAIVGPIPGVKALSLQSGDSPDAMRKQLIDAVRETDDGSGVLLLCDVFGGTPANVCLTAECGAPVEVVTGVNLPMLVKLATMRTPTSTATVRETAAQIAAYGQRHINHASEMMRQRKPPPEMTGPVPSVNAEVPRGPISRSTFRH